MSGNLFSSYKNYSFVQQIYCLPVVLCLEDQYESNMKISAWWGLYPFGETQIVNKLVLKIHIYVYTHIHMYVLYMCAYTYVYMHACILFQIVLRATDKTEAEKGMEVPERGLG